MGVHTKNTRVPVDWLDGRQTGHDPTPNYRNPYSSPSVFGMQNPQGAEYNDDETTHRHSAFQVFPFFHITPLFRHRSNTRVDCFGFNAGVKPVDIRGGFPFLGGS